MKVLKALAEGQPAPGKDGVLDGAKAGTILVDMSSIAPGAVQEICAAVKEKGIVMLDAPVSGGEPKAIEGTLAIMAGSVSTIRRAEIFVFIAHKRVLCVV